MTTAYRALRDAIVTDLQTITDIGRVNGYERFIVDPSAYLDTFRANIGGVDQIRAWTVLRESAPTVYDTVFQERRRRHNFILWGVIGVADATDSYATLQDMADIVMAKFESEPTLSVPGVIVEMVGPCSLRSLSAREFGSVKVWSAEIELPIDVMRPTGTP